MKEEDSIAIAIIKARIESCHHTITKYTGEENIGVRISTQSKIVMLEDIIRDIEHTSKRMKQ